MFYLELLVLIDGCQFLSMRTGEVTSLPHQSALAESSPEFESGKCSTILSQCDMEILF